MYLEQDRSCTYNMASRHVCAITAAVSNQCVFNIMIVHLHAALDKRRPKGACDA
jgi:hypothetical protein